MELFVLQNTLYIISLHTRKTKRRGVSYHERCNRVIFSESYPLHHKWYSFVKRDVNSPTYSNFRGATCQACNLQLKPPSFIPVIMHNLKGYDSHLLLSEATTLKNKKITCIPSNMEKYLSFSIGN